MKEIILKQDDLTNENKYVDKNVVGANVKKKRKL